ncbi:MAG: hypothetical protein KAR54_01295 [Candidatus Pacebacteria bacterium]|nr:hypothetical protein [Candidatus Paceibacterota bacterium]
MLEKESFLRIFIANITSGIIVIIFLEALLFFIKNICGLNLKIHPLLEIIVFLISTAIILWKIAPFITGCESSSKRLRTNIITIIAISIGLFCNYLFGLFLNEILENSILRDQVFAFHIVIFMLTTTSSFWWMMGKWGFPPKKLS